jgi:hypothetical protein
MMNEENMNEELRKEVLQDGDARRTLFLMSFERTLKRMVEHTERVSKLNEVREALEEGLGFKQYQEDLQAKEDDERDFRGYSDQGDNDNDEEVEGKDRPSLEQDGSKQSIKSHMNWLKLRASVLGPFSHLHMHKKGMSYLHGSGSQSAPHLALSETPEEIHVDSGDDEEEEEEPNSLEEEDEEPNSPKEEKGKRPMHSTWNATPSKLSNVRFADDPYGNLQ